MKAFPFVAILVLTAAGVAACGSQPGEPPGGARSGPPGSASPTMTGQVTVTETDSGRTIRLSPGQAVAVVLSPHGIFSWHAPAASGTAVRRTSAGSGYPGQRPARATFLATRQGSATLSATDDAACLHARPACSVPQQTWHVTVLVS